ncbi:M50 family metallopeptidase [Paenibacillus sp. FJAT-26967]|uniref:M50 family metallopeptidase n=1 Tax=Paenibacillus sp. FJAT-26967 TaxID=1729690 RepID=UPI00083814FC|nr:M50 family metallopeptidase [Paenibacillus sp. FJAT-26967]
MSAWVKTILLLIASALLTQFIPFSEYFRNLDTMIHEFGHAAMTMALSGKVMAIVLNADHSGVTYSSVSSSWKLLPISMAGYIAASLFAVFLFWAYARGKQRLGLQLMTGVAILSLILFVRNTFGVGWLIGFILLNILVLAFTSGFIRNAYYLIIAFLCLEESVYGPLTLTMLAAGKPSQAGDATNLASFTGIPAIGWGVLFLVFSLWCAKTAIQYFLGGSKGSRSRSGGGRKATSSSSVYVPQHRE